MSDSLNIIKWRESFETGIADMDEEHRQIIEVVNRLYKMLRGVEDKSDLKSVYTALADYSDKHFKHEEELLNSHGYAEMAEQNHSHEEYIAKLQEIRADLEGNEESAIPEVYRFLRKWWVGHIIEIDKKYGSFLQDKGL